MYVEMTLEQEQLAQAEESWLKRHSPIARLRALSEGTETSMDPDAYTHAAESGLLAILTADAGGSHTDLAVLSETHGRSASSLPIADLAIGASLLATAGFSEAGAAAEGTLRVGVVRGPMTSLESGSLHARGESSPVPMARDMDRLLLIGDHADGEYAALVAPGDASLLKTLDISRTWSRLRSVAPFTDWMTLPAGTTTQARNALAVHRAIDSVGAAATLLSMTLAYATQREQFGVPIGSFQAVKHQCADMALLVEAARSLCWTAAGDLRVSGPDTWRTCSAAAAYAKSAASRVAGLAQQVHGGIGFTWEHDLHLYLRRIKVNEAFDGSVAEHRASLLVAATS